MVVFADPRAAFDAVVDARSRLGGVTVAGWTPRMRAGVHVGRPRRVGNDFVGVSVNTAARLGARARADEILVSGELLTALDPDAVRSQRRRGIRLKGTPDDLEIYAAEPR